MLDEEDTIEDVADVDAAAELSSENMLRDLMLFVIEEIRVAPEGWHKLPETKQQIVIDRIEKRCRAIVNEAVKLISTGNTASIVATLESVTMKDDVKAVLKMSRGAERRHDLFDAQGSQVLIVMPAQFDGGAKEVKPDERQQSLALDLGDAAAENAMQDIAKRLEAPSEVNAATRMSDAERMLEHIAIVSKGTSRPYSEIAAENGTSLESLADALGSDFENVITRLDDLAGHETDAEREMNELEARAHEEHAGLGLEPFGETDAPAKTEEELKHDSATRIVGEIAKLAHERKTRDYRALFSELKYDHSKVANTLGLPHWKSLTELIDSTVDAIGAANDVGAMPRPFTVKPKSGQSRNRPSAGVYAASAVAAWDEYCLAFPGMHVRADYYVDELEPDAAAQIFGTLDRQLNALGADGKIVAAPKPPEDEKGAEKPPRKGRQ